MCRIYLRNKGTDHSPFACLLWTGGLLDIFSYPERISIIYISLPRGKCTVCQKSQDSKKYRLVRPRNWRRRGNLCLQLGDAPVLFFPPPEFRPDTLPQQPRVKFFSHFFTQIFSIGPRSTRMEDLPVSSSPLSPAEQARIRRECRQAKFKGGGSSRFNRITRAQGSNIPQ